MKKALFSALLCLACTQPAQAAYMSGSELLGHCRGEKPAHVFSCMNYIAGVIDYHVMLQSLGVAPPATFCLPENLPLDEAAVKVMLYLQKTPQNGAFIAAPAVALALGEAWPCAAPAKKKKR